MDDLWNETVPAVIWDVHKNRCIFHSFVPHKFFVFTSIYLFFFSVFVFEIDLRGGTWHYSFTSSLIHKKNHMLTRENTERKREWEEEKKETGNTRKRERDRERERLIECWTLMNMNIHCQIYSIGRVLIYLVVFL